VSPVLLFLASFAAMEGVSYATHRWVMHGFGMAWHRSHHAAPVGRFERNDRFPLCFSLLGFALFLAASLGADALWPVALGVTAYGCAYLVVHEIVIHRRVAVPTPRLRYLAWLRDAHRDHHRGGGEPYGMLLPLVRERGSARPRPADPLDRHIASR
jgi:beta-carotene 3-hydroxylase